MYLKTLVTVHLVALLVEYKSAIQVAKHPEHQSTMKHIHQAYHWIHAHIMQGHITVSYVPGNEIFS